MTKTEEINRLTSRHIAKLLARLQEKYSLEEEIIAAIKAQFRMLQDDVIKNISDVNKYDNFNR